ncbi:hypothetical protein CHS0354_040520 [Potamilus streckersoni]|uniref:Uncharacterized protein n=1 Tax=Potamilus streckersoni TaxID=2493646 RepID=A0AAE0TKD1_9BIVA|nr:hypothetical protein CHS0354_040520 [Potamilus streckersoni]
MAHIDDYLVVAAIDLGTTYSSWACSFRHEYNKDPKNMKAIICPLWNSGDHISEKACTAILVKEDGKTLDSFGYEAENKYVHFADDEAEELHTWYYFWRFKMLLYNRKISRNMTLESVNGNVMPALKVFALAIGYLKNDLLENVCKKMVDVIDADRIRWVLTVPAIWDESAKQFMREAAVEGGIPNEQLTIALEPEVASLYCNIVPVEITDGGKVLPFQGGTKYIIIDAGGGTIDITVHEVIGDGTLKEICRPNGGNWGGTAVDKAFERFLIGLVGNSVYDTFKKTDLGDYLDIFRDFERKKRTIEPGKTLPVPIRLPHRLNERFNEDNHTDLVGSIQGKGVTVTSDKLKMQSDVMQGFFKDALEQLGEHLKSLFGEGSLDSIDTIILVGGFSDSKMLQTHVKSILPNKRFIVPHEAGLAVLKGAVLFGHNPSVIGHRICKLTYGVKTSVTFENGKHREDKRKKVGNEDLCVDVFDIHVNKGQSVKLNEKQAPVVYKPQKNGQKTVSFQFYSSTDCNPEYVTDNSCTELGKITINVLGKTHDDNAVEVTLSFGGTEIQIEARDQKTGKATNTKIDFIEKN